MMTASLRRSLVMLTILVFVVGLFGGLNANAPKSVAQEENVLVIGHAEATDSLDPAHGYNQTTSIVHRATYQTLVTFPDEDTSEILPMLASAWSISDDNLTYTFTLRDDAVFANGDAVTADDVVFSLLRLKYVLGNPSFLATTIETVEASDEHTVVVTLNAVTPHLLSALASTFFSITNADEVAANGGSSEANAAEVDTAEEYLNSTSAGSGPYRLDHWDQQVETVLVRNPNYVGDAPYYDRIIIVNMPEAPTQKAALEAGEIDLALDLSLDQVDSLQNDPTYTVNTILSPYIHFLLMNRDPELGGPVSNPTVALAIRYALDYEGYKLLWGGVTPGTNLNVGFTGAYGEDKAFQRDLDRARELLTEAGYPDGFDITLSYPDFTFAGVNMNTNADKVRADLAEVGINVTLNPAEFQISLEQYRNGDQGFSYFFWGPDFYDPADFLSFLPGGKVAGERANWTDDMADADFLALRDRARVATNPAERLAIFDRLQAWAQQNSAFAPFVQPGVQAASLSELQGYISHPVWTLDVALLHQ